MNDIERKKHNLLVYLLEQIADACNDVERGEKEMDGYYTLDFRFMPVFELDEDDVEAIKSLAEYEPSCEELYDMIEQSKQND